MWEHRAVLYEIGFIFALATLITCYVFTKKLKRNFKAIVNCWFCNEDCKVDYKLKDSFICSSCDQYNGFTKDGDYNKFIPEQHDELLNPQPKTSLVKSLANPTNGLCKICNNNQQLKVYQLANFVPLYDDNYDIEIEHFQKQLEKAYKLCPTCDSHLKQKLDTQNKWLLGLKMKNLKETIRSNNTNPDGSKNKLKEYLTLVILLLPIIAPTTWLLIKKLSNDYGFPVGSLFDVFQSAVAHGYGLVWGKLSNGGFTQDFVQVVRKPVVLACLGIVSVMSTLLLIQFTYKKMHGRNQTSNILKFTPKLNKSTRKPKRQENDDYCSDDELPWKEDDTKSTDSVGNYSDVFSAVRKIPSPLNHFHTIQQKFGKEPIFENTLNSSFYSLNTSVDDSPKKTSIFCGNLDINQSLSNLRLDTNILKPKPLLSQFRNPWTGRYWAEEPISRCSSQSSGFYSTATNSCSDDFECSSTIASEYSAFRPIKPAKFEYTRHALSPMLEESSNYNKRAMNKNNVFQADCNKSEKMFQSKNGHNFLNQSNYLNRSKSECNSQINELNFIDDWRINKPLLGNSQNDVKNNTFKSVVPTDEEFVFPNMYGRFTHKRVDASIFAQQVFYNGNLFKNSQSKLWEPSQTSLFK